MCMRTNACLLPLPRSAKFFFMSLEERMHGSALDKVSLKFKEPLTGEDNVRLRDYLPKVDVKILVPIVRDFVVQQLTSDAWPGDGDFKMYVEMSTEVDIEELEWWVNFPSFQLKHAFAVFEVLREAGM
eukprot:m.158988 g.158988  ORF g.158988 m.158988 type:complete len:128 (+) comp24776_c1_seq2:55-438(+)